MATVDEKKAVNDAQAQFTLPVRLDYRLWQMRSYNRASQDWDQIAVAGTFNSAMKVRAVLVAKRALYSMKQAHPVRDFKDAGALQLLRMMLTEHHLRRLHSHPTDSEVNMVQNAVQFMALLPSSIGEGHAKTKFCSTYYDAVTEAINLRIKFRTHHMPSVFAVLEDGAEVLMSEALHAASIKRAA